MGKSSRQKKIGQQNSASARPPVTPQKKAVYEYFYGSTGPATNFMVKVVEKFVVAILDDDPTGVAEAFGAVCKAGVVLDSLTIKTKGMPSDVFLGPLQTALFESSYKAFNALIDKALEGELEYYAIRAIRDLDHTIDSLRSDNSFDPDAAYVASYQYFCDAFAEVAPDKMLDHELRYILTKEGRKVYELAAYTKLAAIEQKELGEVAFQPLPHSTVIYKATMRL